MLLSSRVRVPFPRSLVYTTHRDHLADFVADLEGVRAIKVISRIEERGQVHLVNEWLGGGEIPAIARAFVNENMLSWTDFAIWNNKDFVTDWTIQTHAFTQAVHCSGTHRFLEDGNSTVIESEGILTIDPHQIKEVPRFLAGMIAGIVEDVLRQKIDSSLKHVAKGVHHYLEQHCYRQKKPSLYDDQQAVILRETTLEQVGYKIVHLIAGRIRIRVPQLETDEEATSKYQRLLEALSYVNGVCINPMAQSIVIT